MDKLIEWIIPKIIATVLVAFLSMVFLQPRAYAADLRISAGADVLHDPGRPFVMAQTETFTFLYSETTRFGVGASYRVGHRGWDAGLGAILLGDTSNQNGTNLNFLIDAGYSWGRYSIRLTHISNGKMLGIGPEDKPNDGWNIVSFGISF